MNWPSTTTTSRLYPRRFRPSRLYNRRLYQGLLISFLLSGTLKGCSLNDPYLTAGTHCFDCYESHRLNDQHDPRGLNIEVISKPYSSSPIVNEQPQDHQSRWIIERIEVEPINNEYSNPLSQADLHANHSDTTHRGDEHRLPIGTYQSSTDDHFANLGFSIKSYPRLTWHTLTLEWLAIDRPQLDRRFAEDYLSFLTNRKTKPLKANEIKYNWALEYSLRTLENSIYTHELNKQYQITVVAKLGKYHFKEKAFPISILHPIKLRSHHSQNVLQREIKVQLINANQAPSLTMNEQDASQFLERRKRDRKIYIRCVVNLDKMISPSQFTAKLSEVHFIKEVPSRRNDRRKEQFKAFRVARL